MKSADKSLAAAVMHSLEHLDLTPADSGAATLAIMYAEAIDAVPADVGKMGPALSRCLEQLGASPVARAEVRKRAHGSEEVSPLDRLRSRRPG